ncbi:hypothetical protein [Arthrobacter sp. NicSoilB8]|uniref:hypothetical protein n=1 Tax=Arthrobacter sp. NicSoilB8 TaxID=2830998 RepID=UPI001CC50853|nr:hypothetical protein [Arthrobacter sp. NicSoilB8]BCW69398.1 hypothetical protein NicSoilB8_04420 [Arthrobacter sp. NicSoilB8]
MNTGFLGVGPFPDEVRALVPGDALVPAPDVVMDRGFDLPAPPEAVWPWIAQLGKERSGWYLPGWAEALIPARRRALRTIDPELQGLRAGDVIADWGSPGATFEIMAVDPPRVLVHRSRRGALAVSWAIVLRPAPDAGTGAGTGTRVHLRLRLAGVKRRRLVKIGGGLFDLLTIAGLAAGLRERLGVIR